MTALPAQVEVAVVGGGIGGLAVARALGRRGHRVLVLERTARIEAVGAGILLAANACAALAALDVEVAGFGSPLASIDLLTAGGRRLTRLPLERMRGEVGPVFAAHRADLHQALAASLPGGVSLALGVTLADVTQGEALATLTVLDATGQEHRVTAELVLGADGLALGGAGANPEAWDLALLGRDLLAGDRARRGRRGRLRELGPPGPGRGGAAPCACGLAPGLHLLDRLRGS